jgi:hypothetical protein
MTAPKVYFDKQPGWILGAAVAGGFLLSLAIRKASVADNTSGQPQPGRERNAGVDPPRFGAVQLRRIAETIETVVDGLVDVATDKLQSFIADAVPGFQKQYDERHRARSAQRV